VELDIIIIGAGPAGLNMARAAAEAGAKYLIIEKESVGGAWSKIRSEVPMLSPATPQVDWTSLPGLDIWKIGCKRPFPTCGDFLNYLEAYAKKFDLNIEENTEVVTVTRLGEDGFEVVTGKGKHNTRRVVAATGIISNPYIPENLKGRPGVVHSIDVKNPRDYEGKSVIVLGAGNSAAETAIALSGWTRELVMAHPGPIKFHSETKQMEHIRGASESLLKELFIFDLVRHMPDSVMESYDGKTARLSGRKVEADNVITATGFRPHIDFLENSNLKLKRKGRFPAVNMRLESISEPGIFFTGSLTNIFPYSNFIHGFREDPNGIDLNPEML